MLGERCSSQLRAICCLLASYFFSYPGVETVHRLSRLPAAGTPPIPLERIRTQRVDGHQQDVRPLRARQAAQIARIRRAVTSG